MSPIAKSCSFAPFLLSLLSLTACSSADTQITNRIQLELEACLRAEGPMHDVLFEDGDPYPIYKALCDQPVTDVGTAEEINGEGRVGPYRFQFRQRVSEGRWILARVTWPELDEAQNTLRQAGKTDADYVKIDELLGKAEASAPMIPGIKVRRLEMAVERRKQAKGKADKDPTSLGVAEPYYKEALASAKKLGDPDLEARLRLLVINYWDQKRAAADEYSVPSGTTAEWETAAIKAVQNEAKEAKKARNMKLYKDKMAEIEKRKKESVENTKTLAEESKKFAARADELKKVQCAEIQAASPVIPKDEDLKKEMRALAEMVTCP